MAHILLIIASVIWGSNFVVSKVLMDNLDPFAFNALRWTLVACLLFILYSENIKNAMPKIMNNFSLYFALAMFGQVGNQLLLTIGIQYSTAINALIFMSLAPVMVVLIDFMFFNKSITSSGMAGIIVSTLGVLFLMVNQSGQNIIFHLSDIYFLLAAFSWAIYLSLMKFKDNSIDNQAFVAVSAAFAAFMLVIIYIFYSNVSHNHSIVKAGASIYWVLGVGYSVIFPSWIAYLLLAKGIKQLGSINTSVYTHLIPVSGAFLSIVVLGERIHYYHIISAFLIIIGIIMCSVVKK